MSLCTFLIPERSHGLLYNVGAFGARDSVERVHLPLEPVQNAVMHLPARGKVGLQVSHRVGCCAVVAGCCVGWLKLRAQLEAPSLVPRAFKSLISSWTGVLLLQSAIGRVANRFTAWHSSTGVCPASHSQGIQKILQREYDHSAPGPRPRRVARRAPAQ